MCNTAAKIIAYILLILSGICSAVSGLGIYSAIVLRYYNMPYYIPDETFSADPIFYENLRIMVFNFKYELNRTSEWSL